MVPDELTGILFDIQGFSVHDGPGCRTLIFLKGCPLSCRWCSNPEGHNPYPEPLFRISKCISDRLCAEACSEKAIHITDESLLIDRNRCATCTSYACSTACKTGALKIGGYRITVGELMEKIRRDRQFWGHEGGVTLTGGEPFSQPDFVLRLLKECHQGYIHTAVETCGHVPWSNIEKAIPYLDWVFFDLKHPDPEQHREGTGCSNQLILENAARLSALFPGRLIFRMALIPGYNDHPETIRSIARFISSTGRNEVNVLPVHHLGREKYELTGRHYYTGEFSSPSNEHLSYITDLFKTEGIICYSGNDTPF
jgi:pyruvate formate lyase activating enzyme